MDQTPRLRSAFPATPPANRRSAQYGASPLSRSARSIPDISSLKPPAAAAPASQQSPSEPVIPEHVLDAPTQRLFAFSLFIALWSWRFYDWSGLLDEEEQSLWLFMKWVAIDGVFLFGLPGLRIPWLEWSPLTMMLLFLSHATVDAVMMFRIPLPIMAGIGAVGRSVWGAYEMAVNEHNVNPESVLFNDSLILGRQIIHILPEGSAVLNPEREAFCVDGSRTEVKLPITINSTNPISMDLLRTDLHTQANETIHISKSQIKSMHKEASRLLSYSDKPNEPKTLYFPVKKPGLYVLAKVLDETNLEVTRKRLAHTVVADCPMAAILPTKPDRCKGELSNAEFEVTGAPPLSLKYRRLVNRVAADVTSENIVPDDFTSPLFRQDQTALVVPQKVDTAWAKSHTVRVPISESLGTSGRWIYSIEEVKDVFGNTVTYGTSGEQDKQAVKGKNLHQDITVHERPSVSLRGCSPENPMKVAIGQSAKLPVQYGSTGRGKLEDTAYHLEYLFSPNNAVSPDGDHTNAAEKKTLTVKNSNQQPDIRDAGLYTLTGVTSDFCRGEVLEPASCVLQNPPHPRLVINEEEIFDKCAGSPIGLRVDLDLVGTPPFEVQYRVMQQGERHHSTEFKRIGGLRGQLELTPREAGHYTYEFLEVSDAVYKGQKQQGLKLEQDVKPSAYAAFIDPKQKKISCPDDDVSFEVALQGEGPFALEYELVHGGRRQRQVNDNISENYITLNTGPLRDGGDYTLALASVTDRMGCKEYLAGEAKIAVRHQKPKVGFRSVDGERAISSLEGKNVQLPLRLEGDGPWVVTYLDHSGKQQTASMQNANDRITVGNAGKYQLIDVRDATCPGHVDENANEFEVKWIPRPELRIRDQDIVERKGSAALKMEVCEGDEDSVEVLFKGTPPFYAQYIQHVKPTHGTMAPKNKDLRAALNVASLRMDTSQPGFYEYKFSKLEDANYDHSGKSFAPISVQQTVLAKPSAAFASPGKTYSFCSTESEGEEVIPLTLHGKGPFEVEVEVKHHGTSRPETISLTGLTGTAHDLRIPRSRLHLGKSAISLRRVSDARGCARSLDSSTPRVQISVHDAPSISALDSDTDYCVGERLNFALTGTPPFNIFYTFEGAARKAVATTTTFRRLAEKPGEFVVTGVQDAASPCRATTHLVSHIHGMPSVRVSKGRDSYVDIHEGGEAEILFEFGGVPPFEFTYSRSSNTERHGKRPGTVLSMHNEVSDGMEMRVKAHEEGTYEVVSIKDRYCAYSRPGIDAKGKPKQGRITY